MVLHKIVCASIYCPSAITCMKCPMLGCVSTHSVAGHFRLQRERSSYPHWWYLLWMLQKSLKPIQISLNHVIPREFLHLKLMVQNWGLSCLKILYSALKNSGCLLHYLNKEIVFPLISQLYEGSEYLKMAASNYILLHSYYQEGWHSVLSYCGWKSYLCVRFSLFYVFSKPV